ncbi:MAG: hypothetical protein WCS75_12210 [Sphingomonas sp.]|jgi:hypothetical protein|uniref:hypothetical protein n=1 Tax=Sphingomonas sp. TaxID=28214 RepID=UPI0035629078
MRIVPLMLLAPAMIAAAPAARPVAVKPICQHHDALLVGSAPPTVSIHPLGQEAPAQQIAAVLRTVDGCQKPLVVRAEVGTPRR